MGVGEGRGGHGYGGGKRWAREGRREDVSKAVKEGRGRQGKGVGKMKA